MCFSEKYTGLEVAVIGMSGQFPGAKNIKEFWSNICNGRESIYQFSDIELLDGGVDPNLIKHPDYVKARGYLEDYDKFDADFFGFSPEEASILNPHHRLFLQNAWLAIEDAGYNLKKCTKDIGVFAGSSDNFYLLDNLASNVDLVKKYGYLDLILRTEKDQLSSWTSYKLGLIGPSVNIQNACSTSLVAVHTAIRSLLTGECAMALAGGVSIQLPQKAGYLWQEGSILSSDGHCRAFDKKSTGTVFGSGVGVVLLKRLNEAIQDGDNIYAVVKGTAINNDGDRKINYSTPSMHGQIDVILNAVDISSVDIETIKFVEAHGTGTKMGDIIEVEALNRAYRKKTNKKHFCAIGSVKTNIGHLYTAAGIAGFIKVVLILKNRIIPPTLHFRESSSNIDFSNSPFYVNTELIKYKGERNTLLRAAISSFGIGGTNAHAVLEEFVLDKNNFIGEEHKYKFMCMSAVSLQGLDILTKKMVKFLQTTEKVCFDDIVYTTQIGRQVFPYRKIVLCDNKQDAIKAIEFNDPKNVLSGEFTYPLEQIVFMFSGMGDQYIGMASILYKTYPYFKFHIDKCCDYINKNFDFNLKEFLLKQVKVQHDNCEQSENLYESNPKYAHSAIFVLEYALANLLIYFGIRPDVMIGHSVGEYVAACIAGVFSLEDALSVVITRATLMEKITSGSMLAVPFNEKQARNRLKNDLYLAAINSLDVSVISGPIDQVDNLARELDRERIIYSKLKVSHAFHSPMMGEIETELKKVFSKIKLHEPSIRYISNLTGDFVTNAQAVDVNYWVNHACETVQFLKGIQLLSEKKNGLFIEVGSGKTLCSFIIPYFASKKNNLQYVASVMSVRNSAIPDDEHFVRMLGYLWLLGVELNFDALYKSSGRKRVSIPTYPLFLKRHFINSDNKANDFCGGEYFYGEKNLTKTSRPNRNSFVLCSPTRYLKPKNNLEIKMVNIWSKVLKIPIVGVGDDFFELGGSSLSAMQLINEINLTLKVNLKIGELFEHPAILKLLELPCFHDLV